MKPAHIFLAIATGTALTLAVATPASAAGPTAVDLGTASSFAVLGGSGVTNTGSSVLDGDLGLSPGTLLTGFPPGQLQGGLHYTDAVAAGAQADLVTAYDEASGLTPTSTGLVALDGMTLIGGTYSGGALAINGGTLTLDGGGDSSSVWVFQAASTLIARSGSTVSLTNGANACNVFWQVTSSATIGTNADFAGTVMALTSISVRTGATIEGRLLARNGAVTLQNNLIRSSDCTPPTASGPLPTGVTVTDDGAGTITGITGPNTAVIPADTDGGGGGGAGGDAEAAAVDTLALTGASDIPTFIGLGVLLTGALVLLTSRRPRRKAHLRA